MSTFRLLHTADWHLGKRLSGFERLPEQERVLNALIQLADEKAVHAVVIAGDIFDTPNPPPEARTLFSRTLKELSREGTRPVIVIAGNHDSPDHLESFQSWGLSLGIFLVGEVLPEPRFSGRLGAVSLTDHGHGLITLNHAEWDHPLSFLLAPYLPQARLYSRWEMDAPPAQIWKEIWQRALTQPFDHPVVLVAHAFVQTEEVLEEDEEERTLARLGGLGGFPPDTFPSGIAYIALGHIHRPYHFAINGVPAGYAGSLLQYSFGDPYAAKQVFLVELSRHQPARVEPLPLPVWRRLIRIEASTLMEAQSALEQYAEDYIHLYWMGEEGLAPVDRQTLKEQHQRIVDIFWAAREPGFTQNDFSPEPHLLGGQQLRERLPEFFRAFYRHMLRQLEGKKTSPPPLSEDEMLNLFMEALNLKCDKLDMV